MSGNSDFETFIQQELVPKFEETREDWEYVREDKKLKKISESDAYYFMQGYLAKVVRHVGRGQYLAKFGGAKQQFFWSGFTNKNPRTFSIWVEPIITVAALGRLHLEFGWPINHLGLETSAYAFDAATFLSDSSTSEYIACEAKSSKSKFNTLVSTIKELSCGMKSLDDLSSEDEINAYSKYAALRDNNIPFFWAFAPGGCEYMVRVKNIGSGLLELEPIDRAEFMYPGLGAK